MSENYRLEEEYVLKLKESIKFVKENYHHKYNIDEEDEYNSIMAFFTNQMDIKYWIDKIDEEDDVFFDGAYSENDDLPNYYWALTTIMDGEPVEFESDMSELDEDVDEE